MKRIVLTLVGAVSIVLMPCQAYACEGTWYYATRGYNLHSYYVRGTIQAQVTYGQEEYKYQLNDEGEFVNITTTGARGLTTEVLSVPAVYPYKTLPEFVGVTQINWPAVYPAQVITSYKN